MVDLQKLIDDRAVAWKAADDFYTTHVGEDSTMSADDAATYNKLLARVTELSNSIEREERHEKLKAQLLAPTTAPIRDAIGGNFDNDLRGIGNVKSGRATDEYRQAALTAIRTKFRKIDNALATSPDTSGGYLLPIEWEKNLVDVLNEDCVMRKLGTTITTSGEHRIPLAATKPAALWVAEGGQMTFGNATFDQITLDAHKVHVGILVTEELLADNVFDLEKYIIEQFGRAIAETEEQAFISGTGVGQPTGFLTTIAADTSAYITTKGADISADDILDLVYKLPRPYRKNAVFLVNDATMAKIRKFKDSTQNYLWTPSFVAGESDRLVGYPVYTSPFMPTSESGNFALAFGEFKQYRIADRGTRSFQELRELYAGNGMVGFLLKERVDGALIVKDAIRGLKIK
ncbi:MAG: phage major capsid protein [Selenomonadaceae bacterium]|nr:phage major capsid protein [Selenomonadaceae bacterium]